MGWKLEGAGGSPRIVTFRHDFIENVTMRGLTLNTHLPPPTLKTVWPSAPASPHTPTLQISRIALPKRHNIAWSAPPNPAAPPTNALPTSGAPANSDDPHLIRNTRGTSSNTTGSHPPIAPTAIFPSHDPPGSPPISRITWPPRVRQQPHAATGNSQTTPATPEIPPAPGLTNHGIPISPFSSTSVSSLRSCPTQ